MEPETLKKQTLSQNVALKKKTMIVYGFSPHSYDVEKLKKKSLCDLTFKNDHVYKKLTRTKYSSHTKFTSVNPPLYFSLIQFIERFILTIFGRLQEFEW